MSQHATARADDLSDGSHHGRMDAPCTPLLLKVTFMAKGTVKFFNATKGFGFITPEDGSKDVFVHISAVEQSGLGRLDEGQVVSFDVQNEPRGPKAVNLSAE